MPKLPQVERSVLVNRISQWEKAENILSHSVPSAPLWGFPEIRYKLYPLSQLSVGPTWVLYYIQPLPPTSVSDEE